MESPLALYRRYRPETFAEVIGQDHVTEPLRHALGNNRVNHAYLFSGPRGCGKTTSARILARALNCELAPVPDPCGQCQSCRDLARGGPGSIDVIEIDAASHGGVEDARDLREKAFFAPVRSRYKVYVIDEAHMVTTQGFNALLKLVEEPPPHLRFIFATTEPEKVIPTIRSRTHHYPFRLIPPRLLTSYLHELCEKEGVRIEPAAIPLVVRAGGGSARDTLSVLDQLLGGAGPGGVTHELTAGLLGYTPDNLLDEVIDAFAAADGASVFGVVDKVIETGQDPRRFTEDLLRRLRDLVIVAAVPDAPATGLIDVSQDQGERLVSQAARFGTAELSRAADLVATGLTEMRGATAPRLLLELICARVLLPGADDSTGGVQARLDRIERRSAITGTPSAALPATARVVADPALRVARPTPASTGAAPTAADEVTSEQPTPRSQQDRAEPRPGPQPESQPESQPKSQPEPQPVRAVETPPVPAGDVTPSPGPTASSTGPALALVDVRRLWPDVVHATSQRRKLTWIHLSQNCQVVAVDEETLTLGFSNAGARTSFEASGGPEIVRQAAIDVAGTDWRVESILDPGADATQPVPAERPDPPPVPPGPPVAAPAEVMPDPAPARATPDRPVSHEAAAPPSPERGDGAPPWATELAEDDGPEQAEDAGPGARGPTRQGPRDPAPPADPPWQRPGAEPARDRTPADLRAADAEARRDDADAESEALGGADLLARELGARMIEEIHHR